MKLVITFIVSLSLGSAIGGSVTFYMMSKEAVEYIYTDSAGRANVYLSLLRIQSNGDQHKLRWNLEKLLSYEREMLIGCLYDLCKTEEIFKVTDALDKINQYQFLVYEP